MLIFAFSNFVIKVLCRNSEDFGWRKFCIYLVGFIFNCEIVIIAFVGFDYCSGSHNNSFMLDWCEMFWWLLRIIDFLSSFGFHHCRITLSPTKWKSMELLWNDSQRFYCCFHGIGSFGFGLLFTNSLKVRLVDDFWNWWRWFAVGIVEIDAADWLFENPMYSQKNKDFKRKYCRISLTWLLCLLYNNYGMLLIVEKCLNWFQR